MATWDSNWLMSYRDMNLLIAENGFTQKNTFDYNSLQCVTKAQAQYHLYLQTAPMDGLQDTQLVWNSLFVKPAAPVDNPPNPVTNMQALSVTSSSVTFHYTTGIDDRGIVAIEISWRNPVTLVNEILENIPFTINSPTYKEFTKNGLQPSTSHIFYVVMVDTIGQRSTVASITMLTSAETPADYDYCLNVSGAEVTGTWCVGEIIRLATKCSSNTTTYYGQRWSTDIDSINLIGTSDILHYTPTRTFRLYRRLYTNSQQTSYTIDSIYVSVINC